MSDLAVGYTRLSQGGKSIPEQQEAIKEFCVEQGLELVESFDDGVYSSGYTVEREEFQRMLTRLDEGDIGHVVVRGRARLARDAKDRLLLLLNLDRAGVEVHVTETGETIDLDEAYALTRESAQADADDIEKRKEADRGRKEAERRKREGLPNGRPPFGLQYDSTKEQLVAGDKFETALSILELRESGLSWRKIASETGVSKDTARRVFGRRDEYSRQVADDVMQ